MISMTKESAAFAISTPAPAGGATAGRCSCQPEASYFYSRPCGRGDLATVATVEEDGLFLLTPLREGRRDEAIRVDTLAIISTHAPAGGATETGGRNQQPGNQFLLTPLREGRLPQITQS